MAGGRGSCGSWDGTSGTSLASGGHEGFRGWRGGLLPLRRIGDRRAGRSMRWALPTTAFLLMPMRLPISAVLKPSPQKQRSVWMVSAFQSMEFVADMILLHMRL